MSDLNAKVVADLKRELAEARAELAQERERANSGDWVEKAHAETLDAACKALESELEAARAEIEQQRTRAEAAEQELRTTNALVASICEGSAGFKASAKLAAIRAPLAGVDVVALSELHKTAEATPNAWLAFYMASAPAAPALLAAAREALEP